jgi:PEGA domain-containing protein
MSIDDTQTFRSVRPRRPAALAGVALAVLTAGCSVFGHSDVGVSFFTEPPGARVIVDKKDSGFVTPCRMTLEADKHHVELAMPGYKTANVTLVGAKRTEIVYWRDMTVRPETWRFPLWLNLSDTVEPVKYRQELSPGHVFVRLQRSSEP